MPFEQTYRSMNDCIHPDASLIRQTLSAAPSKRRKRPLIAALAVLVCLTLAVPVLAVQVEPVYQALYALSPAAAQFFQPVREVCEDSGVRMEVVSADLSGDTAQVYIALTGDAVDETTDLYDSYSVHVPFDSIGHCERLSFDPATNTATFLITQQTMSGEDISGGKMTFSLRCFLSGKETAEGLTVDLPLGNYAEEALTAEGYSVSGGGGIGNDYQDYGEHASMLLPGAPLTTPADGMSITAAGYADGLFHVQVQLADRLRTDNHCSLSLRTSEGTVIDPRANVYFTDYATEDRTDYVEFLFDVSPEELANCTLLGDFYTSGLYTEGRWRVTFPLKNRG